MQETSWKTRPIIKRRLVKSKIIENQKNAVFMNSFSRSRAC
jgi:hypothetical protein